MINITVPNNTTLPPDLISKSTFVDTHGFYPLPSHFEWCRQEQLIFFNNEVIGYFIIFFALLYGAYMMFSYKSWLQEKLQWSDDVFYRYFKIVFKSVLIILVTCIAYMVYFNIS